jgi:hypothetical protein
MRLGEHMSEARDSVVSANEFLEIKLLVVSGAENKSGPAWLDSTFLS